MALKSRSAHKSAATVAALSTLVTLLIALASPSHAHADATASTDDRSVAQPTSWHTYNGVTTAELSSSLAASGARLTELEPFDAAAGTWSAVTVEDSGAYAVPGWWWYTGQRAADITLHLTENNARLIDISPYSTSNGTRFAAVMIRNTGAAARNSTWLTGASSSAVDSLVTNSNQRLIDLSSYIEKGVTKYAVVGVANTGADNKSWQWWHGQTAAQVTTRINSFGGRLVDLSAGPSGLFDIILVANTGADAFYWRWYSGIGKAASLETYARQFGSRLIVNETYLVNGARRYAGVMIENSNAETQRIRGLFEAGTTLISNTGIPRGTWGAYVKEVGSNASTDLEGKLPFEPASAIKIVHNLAVMQRVQAGTDSLSSPFVYYNYPDSPIEPNTGGTCPVDIDENSANARTDLTLNGGRYAMMANSDNRATRGITLRYGLAAIQSTAADAGMNSTTIDQARIGCEYRGGRNFTTLAALGRLLEGVEDGTLLDSSRATAFYKPMVGDTFNGQGVETAIAKVVRAEAAALGKPTEVADDF